jgi:hypothetical protein
MLISPSPKTLPIFLIPPPTPQTIIIRQQRYPNMATIKRQIFNAEIDHLASIKSSQIGSLLREGD